MVAVNLKSLKGRICHVDDCRNHAEHELIGPELTWLGDACDEHAAEALIRTTRGRHLHDLPKAAPAAHD